MQVTKEEYGNTIQLCRNGVRKVKGNPELNLAKEEKVS